MENAVRNVKLEDWCGDYNVVVVCMSSNTRVAYFSKFKESAKAKAITYAKKVAKFFKVQFIDAS